LGDGCGFIFSLLNSFEHIAWFGNSRPVDLLLGLAVHDLRRAGAILPTTVKVLTHPLGFVFFQRRRVGFLFGHADVRQGVKDRPAFDFQLAC
jgi:hypothetical protein